jgi:hypothetical protein
MRLCSDATEASHTVRAEKSSAVLYCGYCGLSNAPLGVMNDRQNMMACSFDLRSPRISALQIHAWIYDSLQILEENVKMVQIDGPKRRVYIKLATSEQMRSLFHSTGEHMDYKHDNGELSSVQVELAGMTIRRIRIANVQPEVPRKVIRDSLSPFGDVKEITEESWSKAYRYHVSNGIRVTTTCIRKHLTSHMSTGGNRVLISYEGQPPRATCVMQWATNTVSAPTVDN